MSLSDVLDGVGRHILVGVRYLPTLSALTFCVNLVAAESAVTLESAFQAALARNEAVPVAKAEAAQADERVSQIVGRIFPSVSLLGTYTRQDLRPTTTSNAFTRSDQYNARINVVQPIFRGLGEWAELRSRRALTRAQELGESDARQDLYASVADAYYGLLAAEKDRDNLKLSEKLVLQRLDELKGRVKIGRSRRGELLSAQSQAATVAAQVEAAEIVVDQSRETFRLVTGLDGNTALAQPQGDPAPLAGPDEWLRAVETRPDVRAAQERATAADESVAVARAGHFPSIDFTGNYYLTRTGVLADSKWDIGFQFVLPLFQGGSIQSTVGEAAERRKAQELTAARTRREAERELRSVYAAAKRGEDQYRLLDTAAKEAERNYEEQNRDYRYGLVTNLDVLSALNAFQEAKRAKDRAWYTWLQNRARLLAAAGKAPIS